MIQIKDRFFLITTENSSYAFRVTGSGHLEHLHYGGRAELTDEKAMTEERAFAAGNLISYSKEHPLVTLEDMRLEMSGYGKGDIRDPFIEVIHRDGSRTRDFLYDSHRIINAPLFTESGMPLAHDDNGAETLEVTLKDKEYGMTLLLYYTAWADSDVITRRSVVINDSDDDVTVTRLMSTQVEFPDCGYRITTFNGSWVDEMNKNHFTLPRGQFVNSSYAGVSSNRANPFVMMAEPEAGEYHGAVCGFNLIYSGNHYESFSVNSFGKTRFLSGINPQSFSFTLKKGEKLESPEAVMTFTVGGYSGVSRNMHAFVRKHIVRGYWRDRTRPILINSWEANYFKISESKLIRLARNARDVGIELFVMDDGWFGDRNDDTSSLGDWYVNEKKLPGGLSKLSDKIHEMGLMFGIWVEPEMVSENSDLYRSRPEWSMEIPGKPHSEGRNQRVLDMSNPEVVDYLFGRMEEIFSSTKIEYVKWDMNRIISDSYSQYLGKDRQGEVYHRYVLGLYSLMSRLTERFPQILFEGCASGGNRFDLGILSFFPQIWRSDNTDPVSRRRIQTSYSYGYPMDTVTAHVSSRPNHQTLRDTPLSTRFAVASFGIMGYELNLSDAPARLLESIKKEVAVYKRWRDVLQFGDFYRCGEGDLYSWTTVSKDKSRAVGMLMQTLVVPNTPTHRFRARGLDPDRYYRFYSVAKEKDIRQFGDLVNTASPVHIKQNSIIHNTLARFMTMPGESEDTIVSGKTLMEEGVYLKQAFSGTGYNDQVRFFRDFASRMYFIEKVDPARENEEQ